MASRVEIVALNFDFTDPSSSCSLAFSSLFCLSSCCRAFSLFCAALRSPASSEFSVSTFQRRRTDHVVLFRASAHPKHQPSCSSCQQLTCSVVFRNRSLRSSMLLCSSSSSSSSCAMRASSRRFSSSSADLREKHWGQYTFRCDTKPIALYSRRQMNTEFANRALRTAAAAACILQMPPGYV